MKRFPKSSVAESFRHIRTNLQYFSKGLSNQVILVTSCFGGEGKTFIAYNLAMSLAQSGKKTMLIDFDLRKPKLSEELLESPNKAGISAFLIRKAGLSDVIHKNDIENLEYIPAGEQPPNPVELIASEHTSALIADLKTRYDYVIIDTPPLGLVTDAYLLMQHADINILIVRQNYTSLHEFINIQKDILNKDLKNISLIINDVEVRSGRYGYGYYDRGKRST